ncbi:MAG: alcohol dehydrogenase [Deltaproteobacteria bacterium RBG_16_48_10]|nr:MAG: alcohol dehydrogenase [Deltaproteobacteria bacterium RBG_16_48_10]
MKQVVQNIRNGKLTVKEIPDPVVKPGHVLIANAFSVISAGTERAVIELAKKSLLGKARERPDQVRRVLEKLKNEGILNTISQVREKLDEPMTMGYSSAGVVLACGEGVHEFKPGDRVASNGPHAGIVCVPKNLCAKVPEAVSLEHAGFTVLGAIALQGVRLAHLELGESAFIIGLGLIGQLTVTLLKAQGCRVFGTDLDEDKCRMAVKMGAEKAKSDFGIKELSDLSRGLGVDAVVITASTKSNEPIELAAESVRKRGRVVAVGDVSLNLPRRPFYFKEAEFVVSCSYGPGRYDAEYEERGHDYPFAYVRWTEQRNMQAVLDLMAAGKVDVSPLISHRFKIENAEAAYDLIEKGKESYLGILLEYPEVSSFGRRVELKPRFSGKTLEKEKFQSEISNPQSEIGVGVLGAGNFARSVLLPALRKIGTVKLRALCSAGGLSAVQSGEKLGFEIAASDEEEVYRDPAVGAVFVLTRHDQHARQVINALQAGKHVFVEKPLCLNESQLKQIVETYSAIRNSQSAIPLLMVGYNRRFAPMSFQLKSFLANVHEPLVMHYRINAGYIPPDHWVQDPDQGGGRIVGEVCHFVDFLTFLTGTLPKRVDARALPGDGRYHDDNVITTLEFADGSLGTITYVANGDPAFPKERVEIFGGGTTAVLDDFRRLELVHRGRKKVHKSRLRQDKGHQEECKAFIAAVRKGSPLPIPFEELVATTLTTFAIEKSLRSGRPAVVELRIEQPETERETPGSSGFQE